MLEPPERSVFNKAGLPLFSTLPRSPDVVLRRLVCASELNLPSPSRLTNTRLAQIQKMLNNRHHKCLDYRNPLGGLNALPGVAPQN